MVGEPHAAWELNQEKTKAQNQVGPLQTAEAPRQTAEDRNQTS